MRKQILGVDYGRVGTSATFLGFLSELEKVSIDRISSRSVEDQERIEQMAKFVHELARWKVFATFTFQFSASVRSATKCFEKFVRRNVPNVSVFFAIELHPGGHGGHVHALFDCIEFPRHWLWQEWKKRYGINRIEPIRGYIDVCEYCSKYVVKDHAWWNFSLNPAAFSRHRRIKISVPLSTDRNFGGQREFVESLGASVST